MNQDTLDAIKRARGLKIHADELLDQFYDLLQPIVDAAIERKHLPELKALLEALPPGSGSQKSDLRAVIESLSLLPEGNNIHA